MSMSLPAGEAEDDVNSTINTTPLVDIMLVLLIIFLITIPVVIKSVPITLPVATNIVTITKPENITLAVDTGGNYYWNDTPVTNDQLLTMLQMEAVKVPQPEVHIRGDKDTRFENIGRILADLQLGRQRERDGREEGSVVERAAELLEEHGLLDEGEPGASVGLRDRDAGPAELGELAPGRLRVVGEVRACLLAQLVLLWGEGEVH